ncbi:MAG TPA: cyclic nucleotide-binding domain-containing protein [Fimbriimonadaceae bacterium]|nr:cyclic nucleotide-binding domain-containing protein [Fimbriimonadaceae bacterium]HRJ34293.1 cyclic nucleotide-binding domain-containing protein [Fimbriimonadaceae bacterium]
MSIRETVARSYLAQNLSDEQVDAIAALAHEVQFFDGDPIIRTDEESTDLFLIRSGAASVEVVEGEIIAHAGPGMIMGEVALLDEKPRSATVRALGDCECVVIPSPRLREYLDAHPAVERIVLRNIAKTLCARLRQANHQIETLLQ